MVCIAAVGCFQEQSFPLRRGDCLRLDDAGAHQDEPASARQWLAASQPRLARLLPNRRRPCMLTEEMTDGDGRPRDVYAFFERQVEKMQGLTSNWWALQHTAQSVEPGEAIEQAPPLWPGFESVWIPVAEYVQLHGFLGLARDSAGRPVPADCIVVLPGLWGDNGAKRSKDVSEGLLRSGYHVLSIEPRGHGQTEARYPEIGYTYGVLECQDLIRVSEWLQGQYPPIRRTGLLGFCWGANAALLAAWYDGRSPDDPGISDRLRRLLDPPTPRRHFTAGVIALSPLLRWEHFLDRMDTPKNMWLDTSPALFQDSTRSHMARKAYPEVTGSLRSCIAYDYANSPLGPSFPPAEGYRMLRLLPYRGLPDDDKLERIRVPALIVHSVNDPLQTAQEVADLIAATRNPNVAAIMLPGGGHIGFQAYARAYFYSLVVNFFDPQCGAAAGHVAGAASPLVRR